MTHAPGAGAAGRSAPRVPPVTWTWSLALFGALCAVPAALVSLGDPSRGLPLAFGALPAAAVGILPRRRARVRIVVAGATIALGLVVGSMLADRAILAVVTIFVLALGAAVVSGRGPAGMLLMALGVPMIGAGLSVTSVSTALGAGSLMLLGAVVGWVVSLAWPESEAALRPPRPPPPRAVLVDHGVRLGLAGALTAGIGFAFDLDHKGWATTAALMVMRPAPETTRLRGAGRALAVTAGVAAACGLAVLQPPHAVVAVAVVVALAGLAGTAHSRWYVTGGFTSFLVILMLVYATPETAEARFVERVGETLIGVAVAVVLGVLVPAWRGRHRDAAPEARSVI